MKQSNYKPVKTKEQNQPNTGGSARRGLWVTQCGSNCIVEIILVAGKKRIAVLKLL